MTNKKKKTHNNPFFIKLKIKSTRPDTFDLRDIPLRATKWSHYFTALLVSVAIKPAGSMCSRARLHTTQSGFPSEHRQHLMMNTVLSNTEEAGRGPTSGLRHWFKQIVTLPTVKASSQTSVRHIPVGPVLRKPRQEDCKLKDK